MRVWFWGLPTALMVSALLSVTACNQGPQDEVVNAAPAAAVAGRDGRNLFQQHCAVCHPGGGNIINPQKGLDRATLAANNIDTVGAIVAIMRQPGPGMTPFDEATLSEPDAALIAEFILQNY